MIVWLYIIFHQLLLNNVELPTLWVKTDYSRQAWELNIILFYKKYNFQLKIFSQINNTLPCTRTHSTYKPHLKAEEKYSKEPILKQKSYVLQIISDPKQTPCYLEDAGYINSDSNISNYVWVSEKLQLKKYQHWKHKYQSASRPTSQTKQTKINMD